MSRLPNMRGDGIKTVADLKDRCRVDDITGCWLWAGAMDKGSARVWIPGRGALTMPAALQWLIHGTKSTRKRMLVPTCGQTTCGNPAHRSWGTQGRLFSLVMGPMPLDRRARCTAAKQAASKLTHEIAAAIRASDEPAPSVARRLGLHVATVYNIRSGKSWAPAANGSSVFSWRPAA